MAPILFWIFGALGVPLDTAVENFEKYYHTVAIIESDNNRYAVNYKSTAASYFQITQGTLETAIIRAKRYGVDFGDVKWVSQLDYEDQRLLIFLNWYGMRFTNSDIKGMLMGDKVAAKAAYYKYHHTDPDQATLDRATRIFNEMY